MVRRRGIKAKITAEYIGFLYCLGTYEGFSTIPMIQTRGEARDFKVVIYLPSFRNLNYLLHMDTCFVAQNCIEVKENAGAARICA